MECWYSTSSYFEVDFHRVASRKAALLLATPRTRKDLGHLHAVDPEVANAADICGAAADGATTVSTRGAGPLLVSSAGYRLVAGDLNCLPDLVQSLGDAGLAFDQPTLFVSECVMAYLPPASADALVEWVASSFVDAAFVTCEPVTHAKISHRHIGTPAPHALLLCPPVL
jgi:O-methyltransferase involved in polyketide biosynthesis